MSPADLEVWLAEHDLLEPVRAAALAHHATLADIFGRSRVPNVVRARRAAWVALFDLDISYSEIARRWGCNPSTVCTGCNDFTRRAAASAPQETHAT